jgi:anti-repressor protein
VFSPTLSLRAVNIDGEPWFIAKDVCDALEMDTTAGVTQWLRGLDADEKDSLRISQGTPGNPNQTIINESGLYSLILKSRKPEAKAFKKWVTSEVLPSIRKTGMYLAPKVVEEVKEDPEAFLLGNQSMHWGTQGKRNPAPYLNPMNAQTTGLRKST